ncbi:DUF924 domain-containing protein [Vibrio sp. S4M6]|uniref:DUF924 family protein n=1 Tax=Vibrio sinus TaxID=2946865 RepID=UPI00202A8BE5|nr:DUF924 family protein [Vibrio sinus]MCL9780052.1 DUF924 domain-containing protein [Vibrio sinus]
MYTTVLDFWFNQLTPDQWFAVDEKLDQKIREQFSTLLIQASRAELFDWRHSARGRLAEVILLDQFSRNIYRGRAESFSQDPLALALAQEAVSLDLDMELIPTERSFLYMPYMHSESKKIHAEAIKLFEKLDNESNLKYEHLHKDIIDKFGRYPHRNVILGRESTSEEIEFLAQPNSSF